MLIPLNDALTSIEKQTEQIGQTESVELIDALDRIAATDIKANINVPPHRNSAMDGYALHIEDILGKNQPPILAIVGEALAGHPYEGLVGNGECVRIMTGGILPDNCNIVVMQENTSVSNGEVTIANTFTPKIEDNIRGLGEDIREGEIILTKGKRLSPADIGLLASVGVNTLEVFKKLRVALLATGDELTPPSQTLEKGAIYESNRFVLGAMLARLNIDIIDFGIIPDDPEHIKNALLKARESCDAVITSGGVSVGDSDFTREVFEDIGDLNFYKLAMKPGKPFTFGKLNNTPFFGLPGNPVSSAVTFHQLVIPALRKLSGEGFIQAKSLRAIAKQAIRKRPGRTDFQRGLLETNQDGQNLHYSVKALKKQNSGILSSLTQANCFIKIEAERGDIAAGEVVEVIPYDRWII